MHGSADDCKRAATISDGIRSLQQLLQRLAHGGDRLRLAAGAPRRARDPLDELGRGAAAGASSPTADEIIPAPAVKLVVGSIRMKLPVTRLSPYRSKNSGRAAEITTDPI